MNRFIALTAAALTTIAAPALANDQLDTQREIREHFALGTSNEDRVYISEENGISPRAAQILADIAAEDETENRALQPSVNEIVTKERNVINGTAARIFMQLDAEDRKS